MKFVEQNLRMQQIAFGVDGQTATFSPKLRAVLDEGIHEHNGCIVLAYFDDTARKTPLAVCHDETGYEEFVNHVHIEDFLPEGFDVVRRYGCRQWTTRLSATALL